jgi:hypothetical protein
MYAVGYEVYHHPPFLLTGHQTNACHCTLINFNLQNSVLRDPKVRIRAARNSYSFNLIHYRKEYKGDKGILVSGNTMKH